MLTLWKKPCPIYDRRHPLGWDMRIDIADKLLMFAMRIRPSKHRGELAAAIIPLLKRECAAFGEQIKKGGTKIWQPNE